MNKIYRVVWNKSTQTWAAVSEYATAQGKSSSRSAVAGSEVKSTKGIRFIYTALASATLMLVSGQAMAVVTGASSPTGDSRYCFYDATSQSVVCGDGTTSTVDTVDGKKPKAVVIGLGATNTGESNVAVGISASSAGTSSVAVGDRAKAGSDQTIAVGQNAQANARWDISIGRQAGWNATAPAGDKPEGRNVAIGDAALKNGLDVNNNNVMGTSAGENLKGSHNVIIGTYANAAEAIKSAEKAGSTDVQINTKTRKVAIINGDTGLPNGEQDAKYIETTNSVAIGHRALTTKTAGVAIGQQAKAFGTTSSAVGNGSRALGDNSVAMGNTANAGAAGAIAIGQQANYQPSVKGNGTDQNPEIPATYKTSGTNSIAIGVRTHSEATHSITMGTDSIVKAATVSGGKVRDKAGNEFSTAVTGATLTGVGSVAIGAGSVSNGVNSVALGQASEALGQNTFAGGNDAHARGKSSVAIGDGANSNNDSAVALGYAANVAEKGLEAYWDAATKSYMTRDSASAGAVAVGSNAKAQGYGSVAVGRFSETIFMNATAVGNESKALGYNSTAVGFQSMAKGVSSIAIGDKALAGTQDAGTHIPGANRGVAIGVNSNATGETAVTIGSNADVRVSRGTALGVLSQVTQQDGVALGANSVANRDKNMIGADPLNAKNSTAPAHVWTATHAAVSVGNDTKHTGQRQGNSTGVATWEIPVVTRQITNVAAGTEDTDAVNVAQLKAAGFVLATTADTQAGGVATTSANTSTDNKIVNGETLTLKAGKGVTLNQDGAEVTITTDLSKADKTHYFSVNHENTLQGVGNNYNNDGATGRNALAAGSHAKATGEESTAIGHNSSAEGKQSVAVGYKAKAKGEHALAIGDVAEAAQWGTAVGYGSRAEGVGSPIAIGTNSQTIGGNSPMAIGDWATANGSGAIAIGSKIGGAHEADKSTFAQGDKAIALGYLTKATQRDAMALGAETSATAESTVAIGKKAQATDSNSISIGRQSGSAGIDLDNKGANNNADITSRTKAGKTNANGLVNVTSIGNEAGSGTINNNYGVNIGYQAGSGGYNSYYGEGVSIGNKAGGVDKTNATVKTAMETFSAAQGATDNTIITGNTNTAISSRAGVNALGHDNVAIGKDAGGYSSGSSNIAIGRHAGRASKLNTPNNEATRVIDGDVFSNARNTISMGEWANASGDDATSVGRLASASGASSMALGHQATAKPEKSVAIGYNARAVGTETSSISIGENAYNNASGALVIGKDASAKGFADVLTTGASPAKALPYNAIAIGKGANVDTLVGTNGTQERSTDAIAIGTDAKANYASTIAIGYGAKANTKSSATAIGLNSDAQGWKSLAVGVGAVAKQTDSVALGSDSVADIGFNEVGADPLNAKEDGTIDSPIWKSTKAAVSVGNINHADPNKRVTRQITSVAAGTKDTDAVNVAQLRAAGFKLTTSESDGVAVDSTEEKVKNGDTVTIDAGKNIKVTQTGSKVSIATKDDVNFNSVTIGNSGVRLTGNGLDNGGKKITNVLDGDSATDAVNLGQLQAAIKNVNVTNATNVQANSPFSYVNSQGEQLIRHPNGTFTKANDGSPYQGTDISIAALNSVAPQAVTPTQVGNIKAGVKDTDAVNVSQLKGVVTALGGGTSINADGTITVPSYTITKTDGTTHPVANSVGDALSNLNAEVVKPITFSGDTGSAFDRKLGSQVNIKGGATGNNLTNNNIGVHADNDTLTIKLAKDIDLGNDGSVTTGGVQVNNEGLTIIDGPSITKSNGINAGNKVIADVASNLPTTQNNTAAQGTPSNATKVQVAPNNADSIKNNAATVGDVLNAGWNVQTNGDATDFVRAYDTVNFADGVGTTITSETDGNKTTFKVNVNTQGLAESAQLPVVYTNTNGDKLYLVEKNDPNAPGTKIKVFNTKPDGAGNDVDPPNVIASIQNAVGQTTYPMTLTNVAAGKKINDAVNVGQLPFAYVNNRQEILTRTVDENGNVVFYKSDGTLYQGADISISALHPTNGQQVARATKIGNVDKGVYGTDAVNVSQLGTAGIYETTQNGDIVLENGAPKLKGLNFAGNDGKGNTKLGDTWSIVGGNAGTAPTDPRTFTDGTFSGGNIKTTVKDGAVEITMADSPKFGDIVINNQGKITGVANGDITATSKDAINGSQLYAVSTAIKNLMGGNANVDDAGNVTVSDIGGTGQSNIHDAIKTVKTTIKSTDNSIKVTANPADAINGTVFDISVNAQGLAESAQLPVVYTKKDGTKVYKVGDKFFDNKEGTGTEIEATNIIASMQNADGTITPTTLANIKAGTKDTDAVNVSQLKGVADTLGGGASINADGTINAPTYNITNPADGAVIKAQNVGDALNALNTAVNNPLTFAGDTGLFNRNLGQTTTIKGGVIDENKLSNSNIGVVAKDGTLDIKLAKDITIDSVTTGNTTVNNEGVTIKAPTGNNTVTDVKLTANGLNNGGNKIINVAEGTVDTDAVNFAQLKEVQKTAKAAKTEVQAGNNMAVTYSTGADGQTIYNVATKPDVLFDSVTVGAGTNQVILDDTGVKVGGKIYISDAGLNANNKKVTNVADGAITADSKDAINGSQLYAVSTATKNLMGGNATVNTDGTVTASNIGGTGQSNIHDAIASINTIANTGWNVQTNGGDKTNVKPSDTVNFIDGKNIKITNDGTNITVATADNLNVASVTAGNTLVNNTGVKVGDVHVTADGINAGNQQITNLKSGLNGKTIDDIKADPNATERSNAATIGDLATVQSNVTNISNNVTNITNNVLGGNYVDSDGELTASGKLALKTYDVSGQEGTTDNTIISAIKNMNEGGIKYFHTNDGTNKPAGSKDNNNEDSNASGAYATAVGFRANAEGENALAFGKDSQALAKNAIAIGTGNIVTGENSGAIGDPSIINGANSYSVGNNNTVATDKTFVLGNEVKQTVANSVFLGDASSSTGVHTTANGGHYTYAGANDANVAGVSGSTAPIGVVSVGTEGGQTRQVQNVAAGVVSANSTDAINGSQLYDTHQAIGQLANQTVNLGNQLNNRIGDVEDKANAGVSSAMAMASLPQAYIPGKSMLTGGLATYNGEGAVAVGLSKLSDNGRWVLKMSGSADTKGNAGASIGAGFHF